MIPVIAALALLGPPAVVGEPDIDAILEAVDGGFDDSLGDLDGLVDRAGWAHALPTRLGVRVRSDDTLLADDQNSDDGWAHKQRDGKRLTWQVEALWDLSRLAYDPHQARAQELKASVSARRDRTRELAIRLFFQRRRLQDRFLALSPNETERRGALWLDIGELGARLDALTGGLIGRSGASWWARRPAAPQPDH